MAMVAVAATAALVGTTAPVASSRLTPRFKAGMRRRDVRRQLRQLLGKEDRKPDLKLAYAR